MTMEMNQKKGHNRKAFHIKKHRKADDSRSFDPRSKIKEANDEKLVLFQLGSIASYGVISDVGPKEVPENTISRSASHSSSSSSSFSENIVADNAKGRIPSLSFDSHNTELLNLSLKLSELQSSPRSQVSGITHASVEPTLMSPSLQTMDREDSESESESESEPEPKPQRNSSPILEKTMSKVSNDSLFSLSIGDNAISRDELFSYRDFKAGEFSKSGELLSFCPSAHIPVDSSDLGKSFDIEEKSSGLLRIESEDKSSTSTSWRNLNDCENSDEPPSSTHSFSYPIMKKNKKKKKKGTKQKASKQTQQKKRCWCLSCCNWLKCGSWCCGLYKCCCSCCGWIFCCHWSCCCSKKVIDDEMTSSRVEEQKLQKTSHKWLCCFRFCCSSSS